MKRTVRLGIDGQKGLIFVQSIFGQLSDGLWENSPRMEGYWRFAEAKSLDGETCLEISDEELDWPRGYTRPVINKLIWMTDQEIVGWLVEKAKKIIAEERKDWGDPLELKPGSPVRLRYFHNPITCGDAWLYIHTLAAVAKGV